MMRLSGSKQIWKKRNADLFFKPEISNPVSSRRYFNQLTLDNTYRYLVTNKNKIKFQKNESGFIRTTLPDSVLVPGSTVNPLNPGERLRINFWYHPQSICGMGDESIHDHPFSFQSYLVWGGYEHELYKIVPQPHVKLDPDSFFKLDKKQLWDLYQSSLLLEQATTSFKFSIDKATKSVTYQGRVSLRLSHVETIKKGDTVDVYSGLIHRVSKYHTIAGEKTLSMNIVRNLGKGKTNVYLPQEKGGSVKTSREDVSSQEAAIAVEEMIELFRRKP